MPQLAWRERSTLTVRITGLYFFFLFPPFFAPSSFPLYRISILRICFIFLASLFFADDSVFFLSPVDVLLFATPYRIRENCNFNSGGISPLAPHRSSFEGALFLVRLCTYIYARVSACGSMVRVSHRLTLRRTPLLSPFPRWSLPPGGFRSLDLRRCA